MYQPEHFQEKDSKKILALMRENPLATVMSTENGRAYVNHLPVLIEEKNGIPTAIVGHVSRGNPQWKHFRTGQEIQVIFHGPHTYITPSWYKDPLNVPTWNYAVVHAAGRAFLVEDAREIRAILERTVTEFERGEKKPWSTSALSEDFLVDLSKGIVGFKIEITKCEAKFKLSQNRAPDDRAGVLKGLDERTDEMSQKVLELMHAQTTK